MKRLCVLFFLAGLLTSPVAFSAAPPSMLANACAGCHGTLGLSSTPMPTIAGLNQGYLKTILKQYKKDERPSTIMGRLSKGYTDEELDRLAIFFASQNWFSPRQAVDGDLVRKGEKIANEKCTMCHSNNGRRMDATMPRLAGQWLKYLVVAMEEYKDPKRKMPSAAMNSIMADVTDEEIEALAHFFANQM